ncbi:putative inner membrane protein [Rhodobacteraceae bacterium THAF1]|uniref:YeeE/YedE family protein n=1 Tax=Palleronia sp. THAF1 TaxID=2587842 RepID=UPI000F3BEC6F|nr:YeeE/YedE family protein [Palleronia sp. THAF1]QFU07891.1 putative inner membrane protein [Palleronia sp. THAF1]VDC25725.1 putative inner membrane protein [Rhodobacteraceae bacterium THAF1]
MANIETAAPPASQSASTLTRAALIGAALAFALAVAALAGARYGVLILIGMGFGITLEGLRFGFAGPWRRMIVDRNPDGLLGHLLSIGLVAVVAFPLLATAGDELLGAHAPIGFAMVGGAFVFGAAMQLVMGCGSGTLVNAGSGNPIGLLALPFFALGSFAGAFNLVWWTNLGALPVVALEGTSGLAITLVGLLAVALFVLWLAPREYRSIPKRYVIAAALLAAFAILNLIVAGQPWGVVYGLGLWAAKGATAIGASTDASAFWSLPSNQDRIAQSLLTDVTSLTNIGIIGGAFIVTAWRAGFGAKLPSYPLKSWITAIVAGFALGYSSRLAFGCNVGAFFSGISTGSLHGWAWFGAAFLGSAVGVKLRPRLGLGG